MEDSKYVVLKDIPISKNGDKVIARGTEITVTHDCVYMNGGLLPMEWQEDFAHLIMKEKKTGWKYLHPDNPIVGDSLLKR